MFTMTIYTQGWGPHIHSYAHTHPHRLPCFGVCDHAACSQTSYKELKHFHMNTVCVCLTQRRTETNLLGDSQGHLSVYNACLLWGHLTGSLLEKKIVGVLISLCVSGSPIRKLKIKIMFCRLCIQWAAELKNVTEDVRFLSWLCGHCWLWFF